MKIKKSLKYGKTLALIDAANIIYANKYLNKKSGLFDKPLLMFIKDIVTFY